MKVSHFYTQFVENYISKQELNKYFKTFWLVLIALPFVIVMIDE